MSETYKQVEWELEKVVDNAIDSVNTISRVLENYNDEVNTYIDGTFNDYIKARDESTKLKSIIKEAREYIENNQEEHKFTDRGGFTYTEGHFLRDSDSLLEILDKE